MHSLLPSWTSVGFTGHRKVGNPQLVADAIRSALNELSATHQPLAAVSSAASGADTLFIEEVACRKLPYSLIVPSPVEEFRQDFTQEQWDRVAVHLDAALSIDEIHDVDSRNEGYLEAGVRTVDCADVLLAVWDGEAASGEGGTGDIVEYARGLGKPLIWINPSTGLVTKERLVTLSADFAGPKSLDDSLPLRQLVERQYQEYDAVAERHGPAAQQLVQLIIRLHLIATALAVTGLVIGLHGAWEHLLTVVKLAALAICLVLVWRHHRCHHEWIHARTAAEICRSYLAIWPLRRRRARFATLGADDSGTLDRSLQMIWRLDKGAERPLAEACDLYAQGRIRDQMAYFDRQYRADGQKAERLQMIATSATIAALVFGALALSISMMGVEGWGYKTIKLLAVVLPLVPPAALSVVVTHDLARRAVRREGVMARLERAEKRLKMTRTWHGLWREVNETEDMLMRELHEWHTLARYAGESH